MSHASSERPDSKVYRVRRIVGNDSIHIDGGARESAWDRADALTDFSFPWTATEAPATRFEALWDDESLYFRFEIVDSDVVLGAGGDARERVIGSDRAELFMSTGPELAPYYCLEMDPRGIVFDYRARFYREFNVYWQWPQLEVGAAITGEGYQVKGRLSLEILRSLSLLRERADGDGITLMAGVYRAEFSHAAGGGIDRDWISWVNPATDTPDFHVPSSFGEFRLVDG